MLDLIELYSYNVILRCARSSCLQASGALMVRYSTFVEGLAAGPTASISGYLMKLSAFLVPVTCPRKQRQKRHVPASLVGNASGPADDVRGRDRCVARAVCLLPLHTFRMPRKCPIS